MELEEGKTYSTQEIQAFMGISKSTWDHSRDKFLENFCLYYEYEVIYEGRSTNYHILKKLGDYKKPPSKRDKEIRDKTYEEQIVDVIECDNVQTPRNVARIIQNTDAIKAFEHKEGTVYEYTRLRMLSMFGKCIGEGGTHGGIIDKIWCRVDLEHNVYIPLSDETIREFYELFGEIRECSKDAELDLLNDFYSGLITGAELAESINTLSFSAYLTARKEFMKKHGYYPLKVPIYGLDGLDILRFEEGASSNDQC